jgi:hypothetical protein
MILGIASTPPFCDARLCQKPIRATVSGGQGAVRMILCGAALALSLQRLFTLALNGEMEMNAQATKLHAVENDLKQLMADVTRAMEKAQEAVARIAAKTATATTETESTTSSCQSEPA